MGAGGGTGNAVKAHPPDRIVIAHEARKQRDEPPRVVRIKRDAEVVALHIRRKVGSVTHEHRQPAHRSFEDHEAERFRHAARVVPLARVYELIPVGSDPGVPT